MTEDKQQRRTKFYRTPLPAADLARLNQRSDAKGMAQTLAADHPDLAAPADRAGLPIRARSAKSANFVAPRTVWLNGSDACQRD